MRTTLKFMRASIILIDSKLNICLNYYLPSLMMRVLKVLWLSIKVHF